MCVIFDLSSRLGPITGFPHIAMATDTSGATSVATSTFTIFNNLVSGDEIVVEFPTNFSFFPSPPACSLTVGNTTFGVATVSGTMLTCVLDVVSVPELNQHANLSLAITNVVNSGYVQAAGTSLRINTQSGDDTLIDESVFMTSDEVTVGKELGLYAFCVLDWYSFMIVVVSLSKARSLTDISPWPRILRVPLASPPSLLPSLMIL